MKMTRKLIPAIAMLLISAVMMSTASFAWFSMNTSVSAKGMQITAKNESKYLQIVAGADTAFVDTEAQTEATATKASNILRPTALVAAITGEGTGITPYAGSTTLVWAEAFSNNPAVSDKASTNKYLDVTTAATSTEANNVYTLYNIFKVRMNPTTGVNKGENLAITNVKVTHNGTDAEKLLPAVRVAIIGPDGGAIYDHTGTLIEDSGSATIASEVTTTASTIKVFIFFDGEDDAAITNNVATGASYSVEFTLGIA